MSTSQLVLTLPTGHLLPAVQRALDLVAFGLKSAETAAPADLMIPTDGISVITAGPQQLAIEDARVAFKTWILANGLRDCVDAIGPTLEWARKHLFFWSLPGTITPVDGGKFTLSARLTGEEWNKEIVAEAPKYDHLGLPDKLSYLERRYGFVRPELTAHIVAQRRSKLPNAPRWCRRGQGCQGPHRERSYRSMASPPR